MRHMIAAYAEPAAGPGWRNMPIWVLYLDGGQLALDCIQPEDQTDEMRTLYDISSSVNIAMMNAIRKAQR